MSIESNRPYRGSGTKALFLAALLAWGAFLMTGCSRPDRPNVLWITMDSLRADHLGCYGYDSAHTPHIDALAATGVRFAQCVSQASYTRISVPSMITGKYPFFLNMRQLHGDLDTVHVTVAEALAAGGYLTCAIAEPWPSGFFQGMEVIDVMDRLTTAKTQRCLQLLDDLDQRPFFIWLYYWDPHAPYQPPEPYIDLVDHRAADREDHWPEEDRPPSMLGSNPMLLAQLNRGTVSLTEAQRDELVRLYDAEIAFVDAGIGQVVGALKKRGLWDQTLIILSADHGEAFGEHDLYYHSHSLYEEEVRVPCIIKPPHARTPGQVNPGLVRNMDIMPTILDYCGIAIPEDIQGQSLRPFIASGRSPHLPSCLETHSAQRHQHLMAYRTKDHKLIYQLPPTAAELYNLRADPEERNNLLETAGSDRTTTQLEDTLRADLLAALGASSLMELEPESASPMDPQTREQLKALGYID
jgi:arylsulfatase A-like enzyme